MTPTPPTDPRYLIAAKWRETLLTWFDTWEDKPQPMPSGHRRASGRLLRACVGLAQGALADGDLRPPGGSFWNIKQLAAMMAMAKGPAIDTLAWLEQQGWLSVVKGKPTREGLGVDERRLVLPTVHRVSSEVNRPTVHDPSSEVNQATVHKSPSHGSPPLLSHGSLVDLNGGRHSVSLRSLNGSTSKNKGLTTTTKADADVRRSPRTGDDGDDAVNQPTPPSSPPSLNSLERRSDELAPSQLVEPTAPPIAPAPPAKTFAKDQRVRHRTLDGRLGRHGEGGVLGVWPGEVLVSWDKGGTDSMQPEALELIAEASEASA